MIWFEDKPLDIDTLVNILKEISKAASLSQLYTNHSVRAISITFLSRAGEQNCHLIQLLTKASRGVADGMLRHYLSKLGFQTAIFACHEHQMSVHSEFSYIYVIKL